MPRTSDLVEFNAEAFSYALAERGLTQQKFCEFAGKNPSWLSRVISTKVVDRKIVESIETLMMVGKGTYTIEIPKEPEVEELKVGSEAVFDPEVRYLRTNMNDHFHEVEQRLVAVEKAIREIPDYEDTLEEMLNKMKGAIILMNRMLELWGYKKGERNETCVGKS